jgi:hypothetical protein
MSARATMARGWVVGLAILLGGLAARAGDDGANPYAMISARNVFRLSAPPTAPEAEKAPPPDLPKLTLSGFAGTGKEWKVFLTVTTENPDPHGQKILSYLTLSEGEKKKVGFGEKQSEVELVKIYAEREKVEVINAGTPQTLSVGTNEPAREGSPAAAMAAGSLRRRVKGFSPEPASRIADAAAVAREGGASAASESTTGVPGGAPADAGVGQPMPTEAPQSVSVDAAAPSGPIIIGGARGTGRQP